MKRQIFGCMAALIISGAALATTNHGKIMMDNHLAVRDTTPQQNYPNQMDSTHRKKGKMHKMDKKSGDSSNMMNADTTKR